VTVAHPRRTRDRLRGPLVDLVRAAQRIEPSDDLAVLDEQLRRVHAAAFYARTARLPPHRRALDDLHAPAPAANRAERVGRHHDGGREETAPLGRRYTTEPSRGAVSHNGRTDPGSARLDLRARCRDWHWRALCHRGGGGYEALASCARCAHLEINLHTAGRTRMAGDECGASEHREEANYLGGLHDIPSV